MFIKSITLFTIPLLLTTSLYAGNKKENIKPIKIVFFDIRDNYTRGSTSRELRTGISMVLNTLLLSNRYVKSVLQRKGKKSSCFDNSCGAELGKTLNADKVITGRIRNISKGQPEPVYLLVLSLTDTKTGNIDLSIKEEFPASKRDGAVKSSLEKIKNYFKTVKRPDEKPPPQKVNKQNRPFFPARTSVNILGSRIFPSGAFKSMATSGFGLTIKPEIRDLLFSRSVFQLPASYYSYSSENDNFKSFSTVELGVLAGYSVGLAGQLRIVPLLGTGYNINIVKENRGGNNVHSDPRFTACLDICFLFTSNFKFLISPSYTIFFEKENTGRYLGIHAGMGYNF
jgi:hypothetical protein